MKVDLTNRPVTPRNMGNPDTWENYIVMLIGIVAAGGGAYLFFDASSTMRMVEAGGIISQAVAESQYSQASDNYLYGGTIMVSGFGVIISTGFWYLAEVLREVSN